MRSELPPFRIAFVCGSLEPALSGVADYVYALASECRRQGRECCAVSLNDENIDTAQRCVVDGLPILRLPASMPWENRMGRADIWLSEMEVQWLSVQMVGYAFQRKGIVFGLGRRLRRLSRDRLTQIMFHEVWIGLSDECGLKDRGMGLIQKHALSCAVRELAPTVCHTHNVAYQQALGTCGISVELLPLFSNVPIAATTADSWLPPGLAENGILINGKNRDRVWLFVLFGSLHPEWTPDPLLSYIEKAAAIAGKKPVLLALGHIGARGQQIWDAAAREFAGRISFHKLGSRDAAQVSEALAFADFGIAASPWTLVGKSSAAATMLDHGLSVIVSRDDVQFRFAPDAGNSHPGLIKMDHDLPSKLLKARRGTPRTRLPGVARQFLADLQKYHPATPPSARV